MHPEILDKEGISDIKGRVNKRVILLFVDINVPGKAKCHIFKAIVAGFRGKVA